MIIVALCIGYIFGSCMTSNNNEHAFVKDTHRDTMNDNKKMEGGAPTHQIELGGIMIPRTEYMTAYNNISNDYWFVCSAMPYYSHIEFYGWISDGILFVKCGVMGERIPTTMLIFNDDDDYTKAEKRSNLMTAEYTARINRDLWKPIHKFHVTAMISMSQDRYRQTAANGWLLTLYEQIGHIIAAQTVMTLTGCNKFTAWSHNSIKTILEDINGKRVSKGGKKNTTTDVVVSTPASECFAAVYDNDNIHRFANDFDLSETAIMGAILSFYFVVREITKHLNDNGVPVQTCVCYNNNNQFIDIDRDQHTLYDMAIYTPVMVSLNRHPTNDMIEYITNCILNCNFPSGHAQKVTKYYNFSNNGAYNSKIYKPKFVDKKGFPINVHGVNKQAIRDLFIISGVMNDDTSTSTLIQEWNFDQHILYNYTMSDDNDNAHIKLYAAILLCNSIPNKKEIPTNYINNMMQYSIDYMREIYKAIDADQTFETVGDVVANVIIIMNFIKYANMYNNLNQSDIDILNSIVAPNQLLHKMIDNIIANATYLYDSLYYIYELIYDTIRIINADGVKPMFTNILGWLLEHCKYIGTDLGYDYAENGDYDEINVNGDDEEEEV